MATRTPLLPFCSMIQPFSIEPVGIRECKENYFTNLARIVRTIIEYWVLLWKEKLKPGKMVDGRQFSSDLLRRFLATSRVPGEDFDEIHCHFRTGTCY